MHAMLQNAPAVQLKQFFKLKKIYMEEMNHETLEQTMTSNKRTSSYVMTADVNSACDMEQIALIKKAVKTINDGARQSHKWAVHRADYMRQPLPKKPKIYRVRLMPRGPRKEAYLDNLQNGGHKVWSGYNSYLPQRYAKRFDVYIHEVYQR